MSELLRDRRLENVVGLQQTVSELALTEIPAH